MSYKNDVLHGGVVGQDSSRGNPFPQNAVQEFRVLTQNFKAEYEKSSSALITAVTKSGGNDFHGDALRRVPGQGPRGHGPCAEFVRCTGAPRSETFDEARLHALAGGRLDRRPDRRRTASTSSGPGSTTTRSATPSSSLGPQAGLASSRRLRPRSTRQTGIFPTPVQGEPGSSARSPGRSRRATSSTRPASTGTRTRSRTSATSARSSPAPTSSTASGTSQAKNTWLTSKFLNETDGRLPGLQVEPEPGRTRTRRPGLPAGAAHRRRGHLAELPPEAVLDPRRLHLARPPRAGAITS